MQVRGWVVAVVAAILFVGGCGGDDKAVEVDRNTGSSCSDAVTAFVGTWQDQSGEQTTVEVADVDAGCTVWTDRYGAGEVTGDEVVFRTKSAAPCVDDSGESKSESEVVLKLADEELLAVRSTVTRTGCGLEDNVVVEDSSLTPLD